MNNYCGSVACVDRRRFLVGTVGASALSVGTPWLAAAGAATEDELAYANFGASVELLAKDFYTRALDAKTASGAGVAVLKKGRSAAAQHAKALADLLVGAGDAAPVEEDFAFEWPASAFASRESMVKTGLDVLRSLLGVYQSASAAVLDPSYRVLYASLAASLGQQVAALSALSPRVGVEPFPVAMDLETATASLEKYLG